MPERPASVVVEGDRAVINWVFDYTTSDGQRYRMDEIAVQTWRNGKIVHERYIYDTATSHGKRVQALGGAKNHMIVLPDADLASVEVVTAVDGIEQQALDVCHTPIL